MRANGVFHGQDEYRSLGVIGHGATSTVFLARRVSDGAHVCVKVMPKSPSANYEREIENFKKAKHRNIAELYDVIDEPDNVCLVTEYAVGGSLTKLMFAGKIADNVIHKLFVELIGALEYLHTTLHVIHRDIKPDNLMFGKNMDLKLIDFGFSKEIPESPEKATACGSPAFVAPEVIKREKYSFGCDIWSAGIILYLMTTGRLPFDDPNVSNLINKIVTTPVSFPNEKAIDPSLKTLIEGMLEKDPLKRYTIADIKKNSWFIRRPVQELISMSHSFVVRRHTDADGHSSSLPPPMGLPKLPRTVGTQPAIIPWNRPIFGLKTHKVSESTAPVRPGLLEKKLRIAARANPN